MYFSHIMFTSCWSVRKLNFLSNEKRIQILRNKWITISNKPDICRVIFVQTSVWYVGKNVTGFHLRMTICSSDVFLGVLNFWSSSLNRKKSRSFWFSFFFFVFSYFSTDLLFTTISRYAWGIVYKIFNSEVGSNVSIIFFVLLSTRSIWKWIASASISLFLILLLRKTLNSLSLFSTLK